MTQTIERTETREQWLERAVLALGPLFKEIDVDLPAVRVSCGWPSKGGTSAKKKVIGQCWKASVAKDGVPQLFISPVLGGTSEETRRGLTIQLLGVLIHELIHAADDCESGHRGAFAKMARAIGLEGKMTATTVSGRLAERLDVILEALGKYPHAPLIFEEMEKQVPTQGTRMLKLEAPDCGYVVRTTRKWLDEGMPICPHGVEMVQA